MEAIEIGREDLEGPVAAGLIRDLNAEVSATYPEPGATHFRSGSALRPLPPRG